MDYITVLNCAIYHAEDIDNPSRYPSVTERNYFVVFWAEPGTEFITHAVTGLPNPVWKERFQMILQHPADCGFLSLEIMRVNSKSDPGTSTGLRTVGRAKIPLPKEVSTKNAGRFGLVRFDEDTGIKAEGHIILSIELQKIYRSPYG